MTYQWCHEYSKQQRDNVRPCRKGDVFLDDDDETNNETDDKNGNVPPPWCLLVVFDHVRMVSIVIFSILCTLVRLDNILAPKEDAVGNQGADLG